MTACLDKGVGWMHSCSGAAVAEVPGEGDISSCGDSGGESSGVAQQSGSIAGELQACNRLLTRLLRQLDADDLHCQVEHAADAGNVVGRFDVALGRDGGEI